MRKRDWAIAAAIVAFCWFVVPMAAAMIWPGEDQMWTRGLAILCGVLLFEVLRRTRLNRPLDDP